MVTRKIWRFENEKGEGPYNGHPSPKFLFKSTHDGESKKHPHPKYDFKNSKIIRFLNNMNTKDHFRCGFSTKKQAFEWFTERERKILKNNGYNLVRKNADRIFKGNKQVIYIREGHLEELVKVFRFDHSVPKTLTSIYSIRSST